MPLRRYPAEAAERRSQVIGSSRSGARRTRHYRRSGNSLVDLDLNDLHDGRMNVEDTPTDKPETRARTGLEQVFLENRPAILRFLRARGCDASAEDLFHDLWLNLQSQGNGPIAEPLNYIFRAASNMAMNLARGENRRRDRERDWNAAQSFDPVLPDAALVYRSEIERARARLCNLGSRVERTFFLSRVDGLQRREIAEKLGVSLSTVEKDLTRAYEVIADLRELSNDGG